ncbi:MAG TPA: DUF1559 domain-containing protein, partial [Urbifossiella sp.]
MRKHPGISAIELLIVIGIVGILIALLLPATMKIRAAAARMQCANHHRQLILAFHNHASNFEGELPYHQGGKPSPLLAAMVYLDEGNFYRKLRNGEMKPTDSIPTRQYLCPADPTNVNLLADKTRPQGAWTSVATNWQVFGEPANLNSSIPDGLSSTMATAEHYTKCQAGFPFDYFAQEENPMSGREIATFAGPGAFVPITSGNPPITISNYTYNLDMTFQSNPMID